MADIFLSYERSDHARAQLIANALERQGWSVWWDRKILPGETFDTTIERALDEAKCVLVLWSETSVLSDWVKDEASEGAQRGSLIPLLIDEVEIPLGFRRIQTARVTNWTSSSSVPPEFQEVILAIRRLVSASPAPHRETSQCQQAEAAQPIPVSIAAKGRYPRLLLIGTLLVFIGSVGGLVAVWLGQVWYRSDNNLAQSPVPTSAANVGEAPVERIRQSVTIHAKRSEAPVDTFEGKARYTYSVWLEGPPQILNQIDKVLYHYDHPAFGTPRTESSNAATGFMDSYTGIGAVNANMDVILVLRNGQQVPLKFNMYQAIFGQSS